MAGRRPGMQPVDNLDQDVRRVFEPVLDLLSRLTSSTNPSRKIAVLPAASSLTDVIAKINEIITRIQED